MCVYMYTTNITVVIVDSTDGSGKLECMALAANSTASSLLRDNDKAYVAPLSFPLKGAEHGI